MIFHRSIPALLGAFVSGPALAHAGDGSPFAFAAGFLHPFGGIDHLLVMMAVGLLATLLGGRARWALPASFLAMMLAGGVLGLSGIDLPGAEFGITLSVIVLGLLVLCEGQLSGRTLPVGAVIGLVGAFAIFHGYTHGAEMPMPGRAVAYSLGFLIATGVLHGAGIVAGSIAAPSPVSRFVGATVAFAGLASTLTCAILNSINVKSTNSW